MAKKAHAKPLTPRIADFHSAFMTSTRHLGRFNEIEALTIYETKTAIKELSQGKVKAVIDEMMGQARLALDMMKKKRLHLGVDKVKARSEVKALYEKAKGR
jgi:hypothetical protein